MKTEFAKFLMIVVVGTAISAWGGAALSSVEAQSEKPARVEVKILETAGLCHAPGAAVPL